MKKNMSIIALMLIISILFISTTFADHYYCRLGQIPLTKSDSIVTIKFQSDAPQPQIETFTYDVECIDENFVPEEFGGGFQVYRINTGFDIDSVITILNDGDHWGYSGSGPGIDVVAPSGWKHMEAGDIYTLDRPSGGGLNPQYLTCDSTDANYLCTFGGTSGAAPQVTGILALVRSLRPDIQSLETLRMILNCSAVDEIGDDNILGWDNRFGYGLASALRALLTLTRGDPNNTKTYNVLDITYLITYLYKEGPEPTPHILMSYANCDGSVDQLDITYIIDWLYKGGPAPEVPCCEFGEY